MEWSPLLRICRISQCFSDHGYLGLQGRSLSECVEQPIQLLIVATKTNLIPYHSCNLWWKPLADHSLKHSLKTQQCKQSFKLSAPNFRHQRVCRHHSSHSLFGRSTVNLDLSVIIVLSLCFCDCAYLCFVIFAWWCCLRVSVLEWRARFATVFCPSRRTIPIACMLPVMINLAGVMIAVTNATTGVTITAVG